jgi:glycosyltransferase involved in cell wall biosynthesis
MLKITAIIPTKNEARNIAAAIDSVNWADEILVIDSFSTDETVTIAQEKGAKVLQRTFDTHARQKNYAIEQADFDWIFILDADERVTQELQQEIRSSLQTTPPEAAYWIYRQNYFMDQLVRYSGWQSDKVIRLFRKDCRYAEVNVHEEIIAPGKVSVLKNKLLHYTYTNIGQYLQKWDYYTTLSAKDRAAKTKDVTWYHLAFKPLARFFRHYIIKLGFLDGKVGFIISYMAAVSVFMRYLKLWRFKTEGLPQPEKK